MATVSDLRAALADEGVSHVLLLPSGNWNFSREQWGDAAVKIHRPVLMEGVAAADGKPPYGEGLLEAGCSLAWPLAGQLSCLLS